MVIIVSNSCAYSLVIYHAHRYPLLEFRTVLDKDSCSLLLRGSRIDLCMYLVYLFQLLYKAYFSLKLRKARWLIYRRAAWMLRVFESPGLCLSAFHRAWASYLRFQTTTVHRVSSFTVSRFCVGIQLYLMYDSFF